MIRITDRSKCSGCTACLAVCPHKAISMEPDRLGFKYPEVDMDRCTDCGLCENICPFSEARHKTDAPAAKAVRNRDDERLMGSRSGGVFPVLASYVLSEGGTVYGAAFDDGFRVVHKRAETMDEADVFRGSKYVQSDMGTMFYNVLADLKEGRHVLFTGTPCQVHGLSSYVPMKYRDRLLLADIVCHGVPSPYVWRDYVEYQEKRVGGRIDEVSFRDKKTYGWAAHKETYLSGGRLYTDTSFTHLFYRHIMLRPSCSVCPYADVSRVSDITLADFWGWQKAVPGFNDDDKGVSLVLVNTPKGNEVLEKCRDSFEIRDVALSDALQPNLQHPSVPDKDAARFERDYASRGLGYVLKRYGDQGWRYKLYTLYMNTKRRIRRWLQK